MSTRFWSKGFSAWRAGATTLVLLGAAAEAANADTITLVKDPGQYTMGTSSSGNSNGGEFGVVHINGLSPQPMGVGVGFANYVFQTFCLERNEPFSPGTYDYTVGTAAHGGGVGGAVGGADPISAATANLFALWYTGQLTNYAGRSYDYSFGAGRIASAGELQDAIWYLEDELTDEQISHTSTAWLWAQQALADAGNSTAIGNVRVLTLTDSRETPAQDVLVMVPVPSAALLGAALLSAVALVGAVGRRRRGGRYVIA